MNPEIAKFDLSKEPLLREAKFQNPDLKEIALNNSSVIFKQFFVINLNPIFFPTKILLFRTVPRRKYEEAGHVGSLSSCDFRALRSLLRHLGDQRIQDLIPLRSHVMSEFPF